MFRPNFLPISAPLLGSQPITSRPSFLILNKEDTMSCMYCGSSGQAGYMCTKSPTRKHVSPVEGKCSYCGSSGKAGYGCTLSPIRTHVVLKYGRCSFCDSSSSPGGNCPKSPSKRHVHGVATV